MLSSFVRHFILFLALVFIPFPLFYFMSYIVLRILISVGDLRAFLSLFLFLLICIFFFKFCARECGQLFRVILFEFCARGCVQPLRVFYATFPGHALTQVIFQFDTAIRFLTETSKDFSFYLYQVSIRRLKMSLVSDKICLFFRTAKNYQ